MNARHLARVCSVAAAVIAATLAAHISAQAPGAPAPYIVVTRDARRPLPVRAFSGQEMFALDDLARMFELTIREEVAAGGLTVAGRAQTVALTAGQPLASVGGRLISLPAAPVHEGRAWFVPVDFLARALAPAVGTRIDLRKPSRLVVVGEVRIPQIAGRVEVVSGSLARLTLDVSPSTTHTVTQEGNRVTVRFDADALDAVLPGTASPDLIQAVRAGDSPASLVLELGPRFSAFRAADLPGDRGAGRIVVDVLAQTTETPQPGAAASGVPEPPPPPDLGASGGLRTIVVDAGHGGTETGARGAGGTLEKTVTLSVAHRLKTALEARLGVRVILTRDDDRTVGLDERAALANNNKADMFISVHAGGSVRPALSGAQVFYLSIEEYGEAAQRAAHESESVAVFGGGSRDIEVTPWELAQAHHVERSVALAQAVDSALREILPMSPRGLQQAPLRVLVGANMPAILVELGFLSNPHQEKDLASDAFQNSAVQALVGAVMRYRGSAPGGVPVPSVQAQPGGESR